MIGKNNIVFGFLYLVLLGLLLMGIAVLIGFKGELVKDQS